VRVQEWDEVNRRGLSVVEHRPECVELIYTECEESSRLCQELDKLVSAERGCCAAAGVEFELVQGERGASVVVRVVREGLPARTVIAAFAAMKASEV